MVLVPPIEATAVWVEFRKDWFAGRNEGAPEVPES